MPHVVVLPGVSVEAGPLLSRDQKVLLLMPSTQSANAHSITPALGPSLSLLLPDLPDLGLHCLHILSRVDSSTRVTDFQRSVHVPKSHQIGLRKNTTPI